MLFMIKNRPLGSHVIGYAGISASGIESQGPILGNEGSSGPSKSAGEDNILFYICLHFLIGYNIIDPAPNTLHETITWSDEPMECSDEMI